MNPARTLTFVTRARCHLCDDAASLVRKYARRRGVAVRVVHVDSDPALAEEYGDRVPIVLGEDGAVLAEGRITRLAAKRAVSLARLPG